MDKSRDGERADKSRASGLPQGLDPATAALYAPWLQQEQALLSNMFGGGGLGAYAAAAAMGGLGGMSMPQSYPSASSPAGLASLAAVQQAQQQAAALASLGPSAAAWYNLAGMQQMELLSRLQSGGMGGMSSGYPGLHADHLMSLEFLQAQHAAAAMAAALSSTSKATTTSRTSSNSSSTSGGSSGAGGSASNLNKGARMSSSISGRTSNSHRTRDPLAAFINSRGSHSSKGDPEKSASKHHSLNAEAGIAVRSDLGAAGGSNLSYGIASLMSEKHHSPRTGSRPPSVSTPSENIRNKELEIIPLSIPQAASDPTAALFGGSSNGFGLDSSGLGTPLGGKSFLKHDSSSRSSSLGGHYSTQAGKSETKPSYSSRGLTNGLPLGGISTAEVSIKPVVPASKPASQSNGSDDGPLNLSLKPTSTRIPLNPPRKDDLTTESASELLNKLKSPIPQMDYNQSLGLGMVPEMASGLDVLQSLYGHHGQSRDILASMQDALQRQLLMADGKKRDDKRKRPKTSLMVDDTPREERARHLGRGVSKPKKNTVASLLEHCRAAGIKPQLPLPPPAHSGNCDPPISSLAPTSVTNSPPQLSSCPVSPGTAAAPKWDPALSVSPLPATPPSSLPPSLIPLFAAQANHVTPGPSAAQALSSLTSLLSASPAGFSLPQSALSNDNDTPTKDSALETASVNACESPLSSKHGNSTSKRSHLDASDDSDSDDLSSDSSSEDYENRSIVYPWLKNASNDRQEGRCGSPPLKKRKMVTDESSIRAPLYHGWKRETAIRGIAQSGVRGEVVYYAPCGKSFKQYPDIMRYLERQNINEISRDNFSFSSKIPVGEYIDAITQQRFSESDIREILSSIRRKRSLQKHEEKQSQLEINETGSDSASIADKSERDALEVEAEVILRRLDAEERALKVKQSLHHKMEEQNQMRIVKEQEKLKKQEELKREKEEQKKQREEINRQRLFEQLKKAQEREQEKQKQKILKEQERERRRYHGILVRTLEARKRFEEREKRREVLKEEKRVFKERKREERQAARELSLLLKEAKEDMELTDHRPLPHIKPLEGLKLPPEAFGNVLMIFEFLNNFGETLGFDMDSLPSLQSLQLALLGDHESEEELLNILTHLLVCAIEDPGVPNSQRNTTILGQTLNKADITATNLSEILRIYLYANATGEVRTIHGLHGTEKERRESPPKAAEWEDRLVETDSYRMSTWLQKLPLTALTPTQKGAVVAYVCNELLQNKAVIRQIEDSLDRHNGLKTHKWKLDARIRSLCRRLKMGMHRKKLFNTPLKGSEGQKEDSNMSVPSWTEDKDEDEDHADDSANESDAGLEEAHDEEEDKNLDFEEATKTLESLQKQMDAVRQELFETAQQVRGYNCGQDRFQRTLWVLPHAGGPFLEGLSSCDYTGRDHFPLEIPEAAKKKGYTLKEIEVLIKEREEERKVEVVEEIVRPEPKVKEEEEQPAVVVTKTEEPIEVKSETEEPLKEGHTKIEDDPDKPECKEEVKCPSDGVDKDLIGTGLGLIPGQYLRPEHVAQCEKLNFDLLPRAPCDPTSLNCLPLLEDIDSPKPHDSPFSPNSSSSTPLTVMTPMLQHSINAHNMSHKELLEKLHQTAEAVPIPPEYKSGWWHVANLEMLRELMQSLNDRGAREKELKRFLERNFNIVKNAIAKIDPNVISLEEICAAEEHVLYDDFGVPARDEPENWKLDIALKMDLLSLESVFALEEKITNASMQTKNWKLGDPGDKIQGFQPSCLSKETDVRMVDIAGHLKEENSSHEEWNVPMNNRNPIHVGRARLLYLEDGIERRYLKPPLGQGVKCSPGALSAPKPEGSESKIFELTKGLHIWQEAVIKCETAAQLSMCTYMLETGVAWDKSIMKAYCQFCHSGDFEDKLLLCDSCDKGYHMHCFKPPMENIPDGDWYCYECVNKFSDSGHRHCLACGGIEGKNLIHCASCPRAYHTTCLQPPLTKTPRAKWNCPACATKSPRAKRSRPPRKISESSATAPPVAPVDQPPPPPVAPPAPATNGAPQPVLPPPVITVPSPEHPVEEAVVASSPSITVNGPQEPNPTTPKKEKTVKKKDVKELSMCRLILNGLEGHDDSWPFMTPVNTRQFPTYKKIIKKPVDISTIRKKLEDSMYRNKEEYSEDIELMFNNCEIFNEDDSPVGKAGHNLRTFFQNKWKENFGTT